MRKQSILSFLTLVLLCYGANAQIDWPDLNFSVVATNLSGPCHITPANDGSGRLFIVEQQGIVRVFQNWALSSTPFLDIRTNVNTSHPERGLLSITFPPGYQTNRHVYAFYTRAADGDIVVSKFTTVPDGTSADPASEQILLTIDHPNSIHNGGQMAFGPDGFLYISVGDGGNGIGASSPAQRLDSLLGKILRIDPLKAHPYAIPTNNPFVAHADARPEIWAYGLRNPWRFSFDREAGDLFITDVGEKNREEINFQPSNSPGGQNYGWPIMEGGLPLSTNFPQVATNTLTFPIAEYSKPFESCIIGGYICRNPARVRMNGIYFFGDFMSRKFYGLSRNTESAWRMVELLDLTSALKYPPRITAFGEDESGELFMADQVRGCLYWITDSGVTVRPTFDPPAGNSPSEHIRINSLSTNATIYFTLEDRNPTLSDPFFSAGGVVTVTNNATIRAQAFRTDLTPSLITTGKFTFVAGIPFFNDYPTNAFSHPILSNTLLTITSATPEAKIYYTTNGSNPTTNALLYTGPFIINAPFTLRARASRLGFVDSGVRTLMLTRAAVATPAFVPNTGPITNNTQIALYCTTPGATLYYTLDGSTATTNSPVYNGPFTIDGGTAVIVLAVAPNYVSAARTNFYQLVQTARPVCSLPSGAVPYGTAISLSCATPNSTIYYTLDGSQPTTNAVLYGTPFVVTNDVTVKAFAVTPEHLDSPVRTESYLLEKTATPVLDPSHSPATNGTFITIACTTTNSIIHYTTDGSDPDTNSAVYSSGLVFSNSLHLKARAYAPRHNPSDIKELHYRLWSLEKTVVTTFAGSAVPGFADGSGPLAQFAGPCGIAMDAAGNLYVADMANHRIRKVTPLGEVTTFAGTGAPGYLNGTATNAQFSTPVGVCVDASGNVFVAERDCHQLRKIANQQVTGIASLRECYYAPSMWMMDVDSAGHIYAGNSGNIFKVLSDGTFSALAQLDISHWGIGIGLDAETNIYASVKYRVLKVMPNGAQELFSGSGVSAFGDGVRTEALWQGPTDTFVDATTNIFIADYTAIRRISPEGWVSTIAGNSVPGYKNGSGADARFNSAIGLCGDAQGNIYVAELGNNCIRRISIDLDQDQIPDFEEGVTSGFSTDVDDRTVDSDLDGHSNAMEYVAGTNPLLPESLLRIEGATLSSNDVVLSWNGARNRIYRLFISSDLNQWSEVATIPLGNPGPASFTITNATVSARNYYRLTVSLP